jgi:hypothetical protein
MATTPVTNDQIKSLDKLMKLLSTSGGPASFLSDPNGSADAAGVNRSLSGIQQTIDSLAQESAQTLTAIAKVNRDMFAVGLIENPASTTLKLSKQV